MKLVVFKIYSKMFACDYNYYYKRIGRPAKYFELENFLSLEEAQDYLSKTYKCEVLIDKNNIHDYLNVKLTDKGE